VGAAVLGKRAPTMRRESLLRRGMLISALLALACTKRTHAQTKEGARKRLYYPPLVVTPMIREGKVVFRFVDCNPGSKAPSVDLVTVDEDHSMKDGGPRRVGAIRSGHGESFEISGEWAYGAPHRGATVEGFPPLNTGARYIVSAFGDGAAETVFSLQGTQALTLQRGGICPAPVELPPGQYP
jgi:hypothetical protein